MEAYSSPPRTKGAILDQLVDVLRLVNLGIYALVALVALHQWRARRGRAGFWAALAFAALGLVAVAGPLLEAATERGTLHDVGQRLLIAMLAVFPYLLYRFTTAFERSAQRVEILIGALTVLVVAWSFALPSIPEEGEPRSLFFAAFLAAFLVHWTVLTLLVTWRLVRAGRGEPSVARIRMRLLGAAAGTITGALFLVAFAAGEGLPELLATLLSTLSATLFLLGLSPPEALRLLWRRPEQEELREAVSALMGATAERDVAEAVLRPTARIVGARAVVLLDATGHEVGSYGATPEMLAAANAGDDPDVHRVPMPSGSMVVWTSPYAPFFGHEELGLLQTLGTLTGLALDRARLFSQEQQARAALQRADALKTDFVALASHELRNPVATIVGLADTLAARAATLPASTTAELQETIAAQARRLALLVEQLLDLSRLDAEAVPIRPRTFAVRDRVSELVAAVGGARAGHVEIAVDPLLEAIADVDAFDRIVSNLVANALRYGEPPVVVAAERRDRHLRIRVEDRGPGVEPEFVPQLFERFTRDSASREQPGTGLGLAIARSYARAHQGEILYEQADPTGARFEVVLRLEPS